MITLRQSLISDRLTGFGNRPVDKHAVQLDVVSGDYYGNGSTPSSGYGVVAVQSRWDCVA
jgi:hypothetical protein